MIHRLPVLRLRIPAALCRLTRATAFVMVLSLLSFIIAFAQNGSLAPSHSFFIDCSAATGGDGSKAAAWNSLAAAQAHTFTAGDRISLARGTVCHGSFSPQGSGAAGSPIPMMSSYRHRQKSTNGLGRATVPRAYCRPAKVCLVLRGRGDGIMEISPIPGVESRRNSRPAQACPPGGGRGIADALSALADDLHDVRTCPRAQRRNRTGTANRAII